MNENTEPVEVTITAKDARGETARYDFEYTPPVGGVAEAVDDLKHGFIGTIGQRIKPVNQAE
jgi:hypothetical protein